MKLLGFNFQKISCEKKKPFKDQVKVNSNINIDKIEEENIEVMKDQYVLKFDFNFDIDYGDFASINFKGSLLFNVEKEEKNEILREWKKKKIQDKYRVPLFNILLSKCNVKALQLEDELNLPAHIPLPSIKSEPQASYTK